MNTSRRDFLKASAVAFAGLAAGAVPGRTAPTHKRLGLTIASYTLRWGGKVKSERIPGWTSALEVLAHCKELGAGCLQIGVGGWQSDFAGKVRGKREALGILLEGQIGLPKTESDLPRFESSVQAAKEAGATILRTVCQGGRRYETYRSAEDWKRFLEQTWKSLALVEPVLRRHRVRLAIENHKDWRVSELLDLLRRLSSEAVGVNLDFGNNIALIEEPMMVVEALAPFTLTTHFKDMALEPYTDGFLLSEVPLGEGFLDLPRMLAVCEKANPAVQFNLEMITRDPLKVPVLKPEYWTTFADLPARDLAGTLTLVRDHPPHHPLPRTTGKSADEQLQFEEENNRRSFAFANAQLEL